MTSERQPTASFDRADHGKPPEPPLVCGAISSRLTLLSQQTSHMLGTLAFFMDISTQSLDGSRLQSELEDCRRAGIGTTTDLRHWIRDRFGAQAGRASRIDRAERQADTWLASGGWLAQPVNAPLPRESHPPCLFILFGTGELDPALPAFAWFNSRKPRQVEVHAPWLEALRLTLREAQSWSGCFLGSSGTLGYELVSTFATANAAPLIQISPEALFHARPPHTAGLPLNGCISCQLAVTRCPKALRWICRDRLMAFLAEVHIVLHLRPSGELLRILSTQHAHEPRTLWVFDAGAKNDPAWEGNRELAGRFRSHAHAFPAPDVHAGDSGALNRPLPSPRPALLNPESILWTDYLFHYTRPSPGPWPGESPRDYQLSLLCRDPLASHSALDTLIRILLEGRIRASGRMVRGRIPVVSFSSRGPRELHLFRQWNRSQARWTLEPYGVAVRKRILRAMGAKPTVYGSESTFLRLRPEERFRFQAGPTTKRWVVEREWRLEGDLRIDRLDEGDLLVFLPGKPDAERFQSFVSRPLPLVVWRE